MDRSCGPRSPDLTSLDNFLWGYLKNTVYEQRPMTRDDTKERITKACAAIHRNLLFKTVDNFHKRVNLCIRENRGHFEHFQTHIKKHPEGNISLPRSRRCS